jgi:hypothetical protein
MTFLFPFRLLKNLLPLCQRRQKPPSVCALFLNQKITIFWKKGRESLLPPLHSATTTHQTNGVDSRKKYGHRTTRIRVAKRVDLRGRAKCIWQNIEIIRLHDF